MVDSTNTHGIRNPLHRFESLRPAISPEGFTNGISLFFLIQICAGACHFGESPVIKSRIKIIKSSPEISFRSSRINVVDHINSCHIHSIHRTEVVTGTITQPCMGTILFHHMPDQTNLVSPAPVAKLSDKTMLKSS